MGPPEIVVVLVAPMMEVLPLMTLQKTKKGQ